MRQRKVKNEEERLAEHHRYLIENPKNRKRNWREVFENGNGIYAELGCGKGKFIMTQDKEIADEFKTVCTFSSRGSWSNCNRAAMATLSSIYENDELLAKVTHERQGYCRMLVERGHTFADAAKEVGLKTVPFEAGFFVTVPCENADEVGLELQKEGVFTVPVGKGLRVSIAAISQERCRTLPPIMKKAIDKVNG